jgi:xylan 1,4-beta-xylosidase
MSYKSRCHLLVVLVALAIAAAQNPVPPAPEIIAIDRRAPSRPFPHFWERVFGSGRAVLSLRDSYRQDLRLMKQTTGIEYVRFHAIFHDENGVYDEDARHNPVYNWSYVDQIYDGLLENGVRPFVELSFMPRKLAAREILHPFWYKQNVAPPKDWGRWAALVDAFMRHLVDRYGIDEVAHWYFEVWNEPNIDFWAGEPKFETYTHLYDEAARVVKRLSTRLRVGGPATAQAAWISQFITHCVENDVPLDFVSTHVYANDTAKDVFGTSESIPRRDMVARAVKKVHDEVQRSRRPGLAIHWSEYNASYMNEVAVTDSPFMGPWLANTIRVSDGLATTMSYWTFSDVFEEQGIVKTPFYGGYGLIAAGNIPKAAFNAFRLLHQLGDERIPNKSDSVIVTRRKDGSLAVALWNYFPPEEHGSARTYRLDMANVAGRITVVDAEHGSALSAWEKMSRPPFPSRQQTVEVRKAAALPPASALTDAAITLPPHALALIEIGR